MRKFIVWTPQGDVPVNAEKIEVHSGGTVGFYKKERIHEKKKEGSVYSPLQRTVLVRMFAPHYYTEIEEIE